MARIDSFSSAPPHIHPPTVQAPKEIGVTRTDELPSFVNSINVPDYFETNVHLNKNRIYTFYKKKMLTIQ
jgi:hypothetical protein